MAASREDNPGDGVDDGCGAVGAWDPLGSGQSKRTGFDREVDLGVIHVTRDIGEVGGDLDGGLLSGCGERDNTDCGSEGSEKGRGHAR
jgi:hypothetical protein